MLKQNVQARVETQEGMRWLDVDSMDINSKGTITIAGKEYKLEDTLIRIEPEKSITETDVEFYGDASWYRKELSNKFYHFFGQISGGFEWPDSLEGDLIRMTNKLLLLLDKDDSELKINSISFLQKEVHHNAADHGWWEKEQDFGTLIALCHSELSEALEEVRNGHPINEIYNGTGGKPEGVSSELADVVIRIMDMCEFYGINLERAITDKHEFNKSRSFKHGGKEF